MQIQQLTGPGFDAASLMSPEEYRNLKDAGLNVAMLDCASGADVHWVAAVQAAVDAGLAVGMFQGYWAPMWADQSQAGRRADWAIQRAKAVAYPAGATVFLDVEEIGEPGVRHPRTIAWINAWAKNLQMSGYEPGVYCGCNTLTPEEYYHALVVQHYWANGSPACQFPVPVRGYQVRQTRCGASVAGLTVDLDAFAIDSLGGVAKGMLAPATAPVVDWQQRASAAESKITAALKLLEG